MSRNGTAIEPGILERAKNGVRGFIAGVKGDSWFGPNQPIAAQEQEAKRRFQYPVGYNTTAMPRAYEGVSFLQLRAFADNFDILRLIIETRKDQIKALNFTVQNRSNNGSKRKINNILQQLRYPNDEQTWSSWVGMLVEDLLVIDAPVVEPIFKNNGDLHSLDIVDGSTIKVLIDERGKRPQAPNPAYQQVLYGITAADFTFDELIYMPRNMRSNKIYGYSPVEQIIMTVNIAMRRQLSQLQYYTEGNIPEAFASTPESWSAKEVDEFQTYFDEMAGDTAALQRVKFLPGNMKIQLTKDQLLKDEYDEWLARVVCFAFSIPPTPFIKQMNRSTAEAAQETALKEGLEPLKQWVKEFMDYVLTKYMGAPELEFMWDDGQQEQDPLTRSQIDASDIAAGIKTVNEVRKDRGLLPLSKSDENELNIEETEEEDYSE